jgi:hypothetical protein
MIILDSILSNGVLTRDGAPAAPPTYRYVDAYLASIRHVQSYEVDILATSHYPLYQDKSSIAEFLSESTRFVECLDSALREELQRARAPRTMKDIIPAIRQRLGAWSDAASEYLTWPLTGHFERLVSLGLAEVGRRDGLMTLKWSGERWQPRQQEVDWRARRNP